LRASIHSVWLTTACLVFMKTFVRRERTCRE
jgi:hypothetical protein